MGASLEPCVFLALQNLGELPMRLVNPRKVPVMAGGHRNPKLWEAPGLARGAAEWAGDLCVSELRCRPAPSPDGRGPAAAGGTEVWSVRVYALLSASSSAVVNINSRVKLGSGVTLATCGLQCHLG